MANDDESDLSSIFQRAREVLETVEINKRQVVSDKDDVLVDCLRVLRDNLVKLGTPHEVRCKYSRLDSLIVAA